MAKKKSDIKVSSPKGGPPAFFVKSRDMYGKWWIDSKHSTSQSAKKRVKYLSKLWRLK